ncbi:MAG: hypothetical protein P8K68_08685 [Algibacter sp.]|uniref:hypothetical protein n=1 Tax=Algibacter sp. TaxID=1872428 RepID=UPI0026238F4D|nr:hypothetical protein [Algibacter sp.]MDG1730369.1 hypothetical protein [Algibacter sp.]MDG2178847.1 hypothetical protein [Algibacter sp.]
MNLLQNIENEIIRLTTLINTEYPELYIFLEETPITIPSVNAPDINIKVMEDYIESLKQLLKHHIETHKKK